MTLFVFCLAGTALSYFLGLKTPGRGYGTAKGWTASLVIGVFLGVAFP